MKAIIIGSLALVLSGCAAVSQRLATVGDSICDRKEVVRAGLEASMAGTWVIHDVNRREQAQRIIQRSMDALDACPE